MSIAACGDETSEHRGKKGMDDPHKSLRTHLVKMMSASDAYVSMNKILTGWPPALQGVKPPGLPYSAWQLLEHLRIAQWDMLEFSRNPKHKSPDFPGGYWPQAETPPDASAWDKSMAQVGEDLRQMCELVSDPAVDLFARIPHGDGQTILRESMVIAKHNAHHLGQLVLVRQLLGAWPD
jgi:hypothetical protein